MKLRLHLLWWMNSQVYWSSPSFAIYYHCVCEPDLLFVFLLFSTRSYSDAWICKGFKCLLSREPKIKKGPEQECSLGFYFLYAQARQFHQLVLLKGRLDDAIIWRHERNSMVCSFEVLSKEEHMHTGLNLVYWSFTSSAECLGSVSARNPTGLTASVSATLLSANTNQA